MKKPITSLYLFPAALAVVFMSSILIIVSPVGSKTLVPIPTPTNNPEYVEGPTPIPWQTYKNDKYQYQFNHPSDWLETTDQYNYAPGAITFSKSDIASITIDPTNSFKITLPIIQWIKNSNKKLLTDPNRQSMSSPIEILPDDHILDQSFETVVTDDSFFNQGGKAYYFSHLGKIFTIDAVYHFSDSIPPEQQPIYDQLQKEIDQILSTFKFLPDTSNWKTYSDPTLGELKYPSNWVVVKTNQSVVFDTLTPSHEKQEGKTLNYAFEISLENTQNYSDWTKYDTTKLLTADSINGLAFERYIVADMYYSLVYVFKSDTGKIIRFSLYPYTSSEQPTTLDSTVNQILSTFKFTK